MKKNGGSSPDKIITDDKLVYDYDKCVEIFMENEGWEEEEAIEWMEYNVVCKNKARE